MYFNFLLADYLFVFKTSSYESIYCPCTVSRFKRLHYFPSHTRTMGIVIPGKRLVHGGRGMNRILTDYFATYSRINIRHVNT